VDRQTGGWQCGQDGTAGSRLQSAARGSGKSGCLLIVRQPEELFRPRRFSRVGKRQSTVRLHPRGAVVFKNKNDGCNLDRGEAPRRTKSHLVAGFPVLFPCHLLRGEDDRRQRGAARATIPSWCYRRDLTVVVAHGQRLGGDVSGRGAWQGKPLRLEPVLGFSVPPAPRKAGGGPSLLPNVGYGRRRRCKLGYPLSLTP
jgi:hypothetical protein